MTAFPVIALTGATGFIGGAILSHLTSSGRHVRALYRPRKGRSPPSFPGVEWLSGNLEDEGSLQALVAGTEAVIHCAGAVRGASRADFDRINVDATGRLAQVAARQARPPRFLLISSLAARMPGLSHYAASKWSGECAVKAAADRMHWAALRPPAVYGPGDRELVPLFRCIANGFALLPGDASGRFSLLYVDDLAAAAMRWLVGDAGFGQAFELDDGRAGGYDWDAVLDISGRALHGGRPVRRIAIPLPLLKLAAFANLVAARLLGYPPMLTPGKIREITHQDWVCDSHDFRSVTGWQPLFKLEQGLACTFGKRLSESG